MATYDLVITEATNDYDAALILSEQPIYGSDRIGVRNPNLTVYSSKVNPANLWTRPDEVAYSTTDSILLFPLQNAPSTGSGTVIHSGNPIVHYITAQFAHAAEGVFDMRYNQNSLTIPYNSRIGFSTQNTAVALNDCGNIELYATVNHDAYQLMSDTVYNKLKLFGRNRNLINPGTVINADNKSQSAFTRVPGSENRWYFITLSEGKVWLHTIDATAGTVENANLDLDPSNSNYGRTLALVEDNTGAGSGMLYVRRYNNTTKKTELVGFAINETGMGAPVVLAEFSSKDVSGDGEIQLSPDASRLAVANKTGKSFLWFNLVTGSDVRLFDVNATHNALSNATTVLSANYVYYQSLDFTESGDYLYVMKQTGNSTTPVRYNISTPGSVNLSSVNGGGDIRRGTDGNMYVATNKKMYYISSPETATSANAMSSWNNAYNMTQSLSAQPVRMGIYSIPCGGTYARVMNQKQYELKDHLGNVRVTFSDLKQPQDCDLLADGYVATAMSVNNYYSFGMLQPDRNWSSGNYRFGFNGKENDNEVKGTGNSVDFGARIYDSRLGRWMSVDPQFQSQPGWSPYKAFLDNPVIFVDPGGETEVVTVIVNDQRTGKTTTMSIIKSGDVMTDGVRHPVTSWYDACGYHYETKYYDFETIYTINIAPDGKVTSSSTIDIKNTSKSKCTVFGLRAPYDRKQTELEVQGGIMFTSSVFKGGTNWVVKKKSAAVNIEDIDALLGMISAAGLDKGTALKSLTETVEYISDSFEAGQDIVEVVQEAVEMFSPAEKTQAASNSNFQYRVRIPQLNAPSKFDTVPASDTNDVIEKGGEVLRPIETK